MDITDSNGHTGVEGWNGTYDSNRSGGYINATWQEYDLFYEGDHTLQEDYIGRLEWNYDMENGQTSITINDYKPEEEEDVMELFKHLEVDLDHLRNSQTDEIISLRSQGEK